MKPFNLEEYLKDPSQKIITKSGREVRILCTDMKSDDNCFPIIALNKDDKDREHLKCYTKEGKYFNNMNCDIDLFFAPNKKEGWINIYKDDFVSGIYNSKEEAFNGRSKDHYITTIKIEWEE